MQIGVLGTGSVGAAIGSKLIELGHAVKMGARSAGSEKAAAWAGTHGVSPMTYLEAQRVLIGGGYCSEGEGNAQGGRKSGDWRLEIQSPISNL